METCLGSSNCGHVSVGSPNINHKFKNRYDISSKGQRRQRESLEKHMLQKEKLEGTMEQLRDNFRRQQKVKYDPYFVKLANLSWPIVYSCP